jgi:hypothetical protein
MAILDTQTRQPEDLGRVGIDEEWEVQWWAVRFNCTPEALCDAVRTHGDDAQVIEQKLREAARQSFTNMGES